MTPHPGEFARLAESNTATVQKNREGMAVEFATEHRLVLVLKGHKTVITDGHRVAVNSTGNSGMATGGTGDVLTGLIAAPFWPRKWNHSRRPSWASIFTGWRETWRQNRFRKPGLIASDLPKWLGEAWRKLDRR